MSYFNKEITLPAFWAKVCDYFEQKFKNRFEGQSSVVSLNLQSNFELYSSASVANCVKVGNKVIVQLTVTPTKTIAGSNTEYLIAYLPAGYRPLTDIYQVCMGTGTALWLARVKTSGEITFARYGFPGYALNSYNVNNGNFLAFELMFSTASYYSD